MLPFEELHCWLVLMCQHEAPSSSHTKAFLQLIMHITIRCYPFTSVWEALSSADGCEQALHYQIYSNFNKMMLLKERKTSADNSSGGQRDCSSTSECLRRLSQIHKCQPHGDEGRKVRGSAESERSDDERPFKNKNRVKWKGLLRSRWRGWCEVNPGLWLAL